MIDRIKRAMITSKVGQIAWRLKKARDAKKWSAADERRSIFYEQFVKQGDLVFDIGANVGNRSKTFLKLGARVIAFEPQSFCADILESAFSDRNFKCVRKAVGENAGSIELHVNAMSVLSTVSKRWISETEQSGRFAESKWEKTEEVELTTLDECIKEFGVPSFVKIDVEGYEYEVIAGLNRPVPMISLEFASESLSDARPVP